MGIMAKGDCWFSLSPLEACGQSILEEKKIFSIFLLVAQLLFFLSLMPECLNCNIKGPVPFVMGHGVFFISVDIYMSKMAWV